MLRKLGGTQEEKSVIIRSPGGVPVQGPGRLSLSAPLKRKKKVG